MYLYWLIPYLIASGNCALVTKKDEMPFPWSSSINLLISGYMIGSPTKDKAQCWGSKPSANLSALTPGTPVFKKDNKWLRSIQNITTCLF